MTISGTNVGLRHFSKFTCFFTLFLIFVGGMVTSTGSGLAVPDWPLSYGTLFPPMVGGVFYEHGHRMVAALAGCLTLCLAIWLGVAEKRRWVRTLGFCSFAAVAVQGLLGGLTVLFFLPTPISVSHAVLAQTFFIFTILIAYSQSKERELAEKSARDVDPVRDGISNGVNPRILRLSLLFGILVYVQLILGSLMRHTGSGLAIPEILFFIHLLGAIVIAIVLCWLNRVCIKIYTKESRILSSLFLLDLLTLAQLLLGISTVLTQKSATLTSFHVVTGAAVLGVSVVLVLRSAPLSFQETKRLLLT
ncbi:MAG: COX15/CtaA family protein [Candidatus Omnitrophica bacterium]|nr:COX15/CtaA family protein [Candidatus Omnitrophota bacterium]